MRMTDRSCRLAIRSPGCRYCPRLTLRMPSTPVNGAVMMRRSMVAVREIDWAIRESYFDCASSRSVCETTLSFTSCRLRLRSASAAGICACVALRSACSLLLSSRTSGSPTFASLPESNRISATTPASDPLTSTPCTASATPIEVIFSCHSISVAAVAATSMAGPAAAAGVPSFAVCPLLSLRQGSRRPQRP